MGGVQWAIASNYKTQDGALGLGFDWSLVYQAAVWCPTLNVYSPCGPSVLALRITPVRAMEGCACSGVSR